MKVRDNDGVRIKVAILLPSVYESEAHMKEAWDGMLAQLNDLLKKPNLKLASDAYVCTKPYN